ncbi:unnamed protein product, partial [Staurois parvus]
ASLVRQAGSISIGQVGTGGASGEWLGSQARDQSRRMVRQARDQSRVSNESDRSRNRNRVAGTGYRAQEKHTPRQSLQVWLSLKYTSIISSRCFGWLQG